MAKRFLRKRRNGNGNKPRCWYGEHVIRGKVYNWHGHPVCGSCYKKCCKKLKGATPPSRPPKRDSRGLIARIFNW